ncbi:hypothetical protein DDSR119_61 [Pseudomonas phage DDSR119]|nr:hypothetical protein DDSR119_61 [Pseudomonas phage DDSR119]
MAKLRPLPWQSTKGHDALPNYEHVDVSQDDFKPWREFDVIYVKAYMLNGVWMCADGRPLGYYPKWLRRWVEQVEDGEATRDDGCGRIDMEQQQDGTALFVLHDHEGDKFAEARLDISSMIAMREWLNKALGDQYPL